MPVFVNAEIRRVEQEEFGRIAYDVMEHVFAVHNEMGRFFSEDIYRDAVARRIPNSQAEVLVQVRFEDFVKSYFLDLLVDGRCVFEMKSVERLGAVQRAQVLNYLLLSDLSHGKLVNFRGERVEHEFVNSNLRREDRVEFRIADRGWREHASSRRSLREWMIEFVRDVGAGLSVRLYESAASHLFGGDAAVLGAIDIHCDGKTLRRQKARLIAPDWGMEVTAVEEPRMAKVEAHLRKFLGHTALRGLNWININRSHLTFTTIEQ